MPVNPLTQQQIDDLRAAQRAIPELEAQIKLAEQAGIDMAQQKQRLSELREQVDKLIRVYGELPPAPPG